MSEKTITPSLSILYCVVSLFFSSLIAAIIEFQHFYIKITRFVFTHIKNLPQNRWVEADDKKEERDNEILLTHEGILTENDIEVVMEKLGMGSFHEGECREGWLFDGATVLLEEKEATVEELKEAFSMFDENGDGFINKVELQRIMCRLEFKEGMKLENCDKMIAAFDANGDGRIDFNEFKNMLENVN